MFGVVFGVLGMALIESAMSSKKVAIIGGGISGLSCANQLAKRGILSTVFDTGKIIAGGRCSSRVINIEGQDIVMDHSAQFIVAQDPTFLAWCEESERQGYLQKWEGPIGRIASNEPFQPISSFPPRYVGSKGMRSVVEALCKPLPDVRINQWINQMEKTSSGKWTIKGNRKSIGDYDAVVIAHNGKCADRLLSTAGSPRIHSLLKVNFGPSLPLDLSKMRKMQLCSLFVMGVVFEQPLGQTFEGAYLQDDRGILSWVCNSSAKMKSSNGSYESWTLVSTREYAANNKVPQEAIPMDIDLKVKREMLESFAASAGLSLSSLKVKFSKIQLWGARQLHI